MNLWIRSQDKKDLVKVNSLWIIDNQIWMEVPFYENHKKLGLTISGHNHKLAEYKTEERALAVLNEIQEMMSTELKIKGDYEECDLYIKTMILNTMIKVYQMPEK